MFNYHFFCVLSFIHSLTSSTSTRMIFGEYYPGSFSFGTFSPGWRRSCREEKKFCYFFSNLFDIREIRPSSGKCVRVPFLGSSAPNNAQSVDHQHSKLYAGPKSDRVSNRSLSIRPDDLHHQLPNHPVFNVIPDKRDVTHLVWIEGPQKLMSYIHLTQCVLW